MKKKVGESEIKALISSLGLEFEYSETTSGWMIKSVKSGEIVGSHRGDGSRAKFLRKDDDGVIASDLFKFFEKEGVFEHYGMEADAAGGIDPEDPHTTRFGAGATDEEQTEEPDVESFVASLLAGYTGADLAELGGVYSDGSDSDNNRL